MMQGMVWRSLCRLAMLAWPSLLVFLRCHPQATCREVKSALQLVGALEGQHQPARTWVAGDLNVSPKHLSPKHPLHWAVTSGSGPLARFVVVLPKDTATHFTHREGVPDHTAIDHAYVRGPVEDVTHLLVHTGSDSRVSPVLQSSLRCSMFCYGT